MMGLSSFRAWLRDLPECLFPNTHRKRRPSRKVRRFRPQVQLLEERCLLDAALGDLAFADPFAELASADNLLRDPLGQEPPALVHHLAPSGNAAVPGTSSIGGGAGGTAVSGPSTTTAGPSSDGAPVQQALLEAMATGALPVPAGAGAGSFSLSGPAAPASAPTSSGAAARPASLVAATSGGTRAALGSGTGAAASSSLLSTSSHGTSFTLTGAVGAEVAAFAAAAEWGGSSGTLTLSEVPADALIEFATLYATLDLAGPVTASATFAGQSLGDASPYSILEIEEPLYYTHSAYKWDVTALVSGNGGYQASLSGDGYSYGLTLVVAFSHPDLPAGSVVVNDGLVDVSTGHSGPDSESTTLEALAGSYDLWVHTVGDDGPEVVGYGNQTDEQILFNDTPVGGPLDHNLGLYASLVRMPVTTVDGTNTVTLASQDDWLSWDVTVLAPRNSSPGGTVGDYVWEDTNADGIQDVGEPGLANVTVNLLVDGAVVQSAVTDANGLYQFTVSDTAPMYQIQVLLPTGYAATAAYAGPEDGDSNIDGGGYSELFSVAAGSSNLTLDAGLVPTVSTTATDPNAAEEGQDPGEITISRAGGDLSAPLTVYYHVNGTASSGDDYSGTPEGDNSVEIPAYQTSVTLPIVPVDDDEAEGPETISVFLVEPPSGAGYTVGAQSRADVFLADNEAVAPAQTKLKDPGAMPEQAGYGTVGVVAYGERKLNNDNVGAANAKDNFVSMDAVFAFANVLDVVFEVYDREGTTEFKFEVNVINNTGADWTRMEFALGFGTWMTPAEDFFQLSNDFDFLDFDFIHLDPTPEDAYKRFRGGTFTHDSNELIWSGGRVQSGFDKPAVFFFQVDLPDYSTEMPASARTATGYKFTLRMFPGG